MYGAVSGPIRRVIVLDPVFKRAMPQLSKWINEQVSAGKFGEILTRTSAAGVDYGIRYKEWAVWGIVFAEYMRRTMGSDAP